VKICPVCATEYRDDVRFCPNDGQTLRSSGPTQDLVGQVLADRYHIVKKLGEGGMGQVYLAEHVKMGRRSAIKVMNPSMVHAPEAVARFNREAANASRISDSHVCAVYDFGETPDGLIYLVMEFIEGEPLTELIREEGALPVARAADIASLTQLRSDGSVRDVIQLSPGRDVAIGREQGDWVFPYDPSMSARHALVRSEDADFVVVDANSRNGIALAARGDMTLRDQARILVGDKLLRIEIPT